MSRKIEVGNIGKIIISKNIKNEIDYLHREVGKTEWSGILIYSFESGNFKSLKDLVFKANHVYLMNIGSHGFTSFKYDEKVVDMYDKVEGAIEQMTGLIHTHHSMGAFISGTDEGELMGNCAKYNFYVSLVVDLFGTYVCRIAIPSKTKTVSENEVIDINGKKTIIKTVSEDASVIIGVLDIEFEEPQIVVPEWLIGITKSCKDAKVVEEQAEKVTPVVSNNFSNQNFNKWDAFDEKWDNYTSNLGNKSIITLNEKFAIAILNVDAHISRSIDESIASLNKLNDVDFKMYIDLLDGNIEMLFGEVFNIRDSYMNSKINSVINLLNTYTGIYETNLDKLIEFLEEYAAV